MGNKTNQVNDAAPGRCCIASLLMVMTVGLGFCLGAAERELAQDDASLLVNAIRDRNEFAVDQLLSTNAHLANVASEDGAFPLHEAVSAGNLNVVSSLVKAGAQIDQVGRDNWIPLDIAVIREQWDVAELLIAHGAIFTLQSAAALGDHERVREILKPHPNTVDNRVGHWTALHLSSMKNHPKVVSELIKAGADVRATGLEGLMPVHVAARFGADHIVGLLLRAGVDPNSKDKYLRTPVYLAAGDGHAQSILILLKQGALPFSETISGDTSLEAAARGGHAEVLSVLLKLHPRPGSIDRSLYLAAEEGEAKVLSLLAKAGGSINVRQGQMTALGVAARRGHDEVVAELLGLGATVDLADGEQQTALHHAATEGHAAIVQRLLLSGADRSIRDRHGFTPADHAKINHQAATSKLLDEQPRSRQPVRLRAR